MVCRGASLHPSLFRVRQPGWEVTAPRSGPASQVLASGYKMTWGLQTWAGAPTFQVCQLADLHLEASGPKDRGTESGGVGGQVLCLPSFTLPSWLGDGTQGAPSPKPLRCR